ncbi:MAG: hypothetical protein HWE27_05815 [Gammaproteobacteria bacterium]|nr:hypothetical protein [Gammaproteobacteria bacterium]
MNVIKLLEELGEKTLTNKSITELSPEELELYKKSLPDIVCMIAPAEDDDETEETPQEEPSEIPEKEEKQA